MASPKESAAYWRHKYVTGGGARALRYYLQAKGRMGQYDGRMLKDPGTTYRPPSPPSAAVRAFIARGFAAGLVPTFTSNGQHSPGSLHAQHRAADLGLRGREVGSAAGQRKMEAFQAAEFKRFRAGGHYVELIGPINNRIVLRGRATVLAEGALLEQQHDNHVHGGF